MNHRPTYGELLVALDLAYRIAEESGCLTYPAHVPRTEDLGMDVCAECGDTAVEADPYEIEHKPGCQVGRLLAFMKRLKPGWEFVGPPCVIDAEHGTLLDDPVLLRAIWENWDPPSEGGWNAYAKLERREQVMLQRSYVAPPPHPAVCVTGTAEHAAWFQPDGSVVCADCGLKGAQ